MTQQINPYQPTTPLATEPLESERLSFSGTIELADYAALIDRSRFERGLYVTLAVLLIPNALLFLVIGAGLFSRGGPPIAMVVGWVAFALSALGIYFCFVRFNNRYEARRRLRRHPDLIGPAQGEITHAGLRFNDDVHQYWFGPIHLASAVVLQHGIRVYTEGNPERFLALSERLFDAYDVNLASRLREHWRTVANDSAAEPEDEIADPPGMALWREIAETPEHAVAFGGLVTQAMPLRTPERRNQAISELVVGVFTIVVVGFFPVQLEPWIFWLAVVYGVYCLLHNIKSWRTYLYGTEVHRWQQSGWISPAEIAVCNHVNGVRMPLNKFRELVVDEDNIRLVGQRNAAYYFPRASFANDRDWQRAVEYLKASVAVSG